MFIVEKFGSVGHTDDVATVRLAAEVTEIIVQVVKFRRQKEIFHDVIRLHFILQ